jgi:hypothetical protein
MKSQLTSMGLALASAGALGEAECDMTTAVTSAATIAAANTWKAEKVMRAPSV